MSTHSPSSAHQDTRTRSRGAKPRTLARYQRPSTGQQAHTSPPMSGRPPPPKGAALLTGWCCGVLDFSPSSEALENLSNADRKASPRRCEAKASASLFSAIVARTKFTTQVTSSSAGFFSSDKAPPHRSAASTASARRAKSCATRASGASEARSIKSASCSPR
eukprot:Skav207287  [mRNA]  locus=scaffold434:201371:202955:+ [translate_table: standard]